jgi:hypothetical protein
LQFIKGRRACSNTEPREARCNRATGNENNVAPAPSKRHNIIGEPLNKVSTEPLTIVSQHSASYFDYPAMGVSDSLA